MAARTPAARVRALARRLGMVPGPPRARSWLDVLFVAWLGWLYDAMNNLAAVRQRLAEAHALSLLHLEHTLHVAPELSLNRGLAGHPALRDVTAFWYENVHGVVVIATFLVLWWLRPDLLRRLRAVLLLISVAALVVFWSYPVAPPRMLVADGYHDLVAVSDGQPVWQSGAVAADSNQLAAFPSLHLAWGLWASLALCLMSAPLSAAPRRVVRAAAVVYPLVTLYAVMATGNHLLLDAVAGAALCALATGVVWLVSTRRSTARRPALATGG